MFKPSITITTLLSFMFYLIGCSSSSWITLDELENYEGGIIKGVITNDNKGYRYEIVSEETPVIKDSLLIGFIKSSDISETKSLTEWTIPISKIKSINVETSDYTQPIMLALVVGGLLYLILGAFKDEVVDPITF